MEIIRRQILFVVVLLVIAIGISFKIYMDGGVSFGIKEDKVAYCGTVVDNFSDRLADNNGSKADGKALFAQNCASCHAIHKKLTGPALADLDKRFPMHLLVSFIHNPDKAIPKNKYLEDLYKDYNQTKMNAFPNLSQDEIKTIMAYAGVRM